MNFSNDEDDERFDGSLDQSQELDYRCLECQEPRESDGFQCSDPSQANHHICAACFRLLPKRSPNSPTSCKICSRNFCTPYHSSCCNGDTIQKLTNLDQINLPSNLNLSIFRRNIIELNVNPFFILREVMIF